MSPSGAIRPLRSQPCSVPGGVSGGDSAAGRSQGATSLQEPCWQMPGECQEAGWVSHPPKSQMHGPGIPLPARSPGAPQKAKLGVPKGQFKQLSPNTSTKGKRAGQPC